MRIISGKFKGRKLNPPIAKWNTRPTMDFSREALFNILVNRYDLSGIKVLDLFGGTGSVSLEFISRGCEEVVFVDLNPACIRYVAAEAKVLEIASELKLVKDDAIKFLGKLNEPFDIIFSDPPYDYPHYEKIHCIIFEKNLLKTNGMLILEHDRKMDFSHLAYFREIRKYGGSHFSFFSL